MSVLQSRRTRWMLERYAKMTPAERQKVEDTVVAIESGELHLAEAALKARNFDFCNISLGGCQSLCEQR